MTPTCPLSLEVWIDLRPYQFPPFNVVTLAHPIRVGNYAWIGAGAIIMPDITIGARAVVGAGSIVTKGVPANMFAAGHPARILKSAVDD